MAAGNIFRATLLSAVLAAGTAAAQTPLTAGLVADGASRPSLSPASDPAETLARYLRILASDPRDLEALTGAGHAALEIGDANAALAFYARAEEIAPRNGRIKAGIGSALVQLQKPKEAIRLFDDAVDLGVPETDIASDRGLAWDLRGDPKRAQKAYAIALAASGDDETKRRMALSMAISGDGAGGTVLLDPLLRRNDRAAWRARAFILAMGGDVPGAEVVARSAMSAAQVATLHPFLVRLAALRPAQKALAVNFGEIPSDGRTYSPSELAALDVPAPRGGAVGQGLVPDGEPFGSLDAARATAPSASTEKLSAAPRRRPGAADPDSRTAPDRPGPAAAPVALASASPVRALPQGAASPTAGAAQSRGAVTVGPVAPVADRPRPPRVTIVYAPAAKLAPVVIALAAPPPGPVAQPVPQAVSPPATAAPASIPGGPGAVPSPIRFALKAEQSRASSIFTLEPSITAQARSEEAARAARATPAPERKLALAAKDDAPRNGQAAKAVAIALNERGAGTRTEPDPKKASKVPETKSRTTAAKAGALDERAKTAKEVDKQSAGSKSAKTEGKDEDAKAKTATAKADAKKAKAKSDKEDGEKSAKGAPARVWVQVAGGASTADLPKAWDKLKPKAPALGKGQSVYTTPLRATNRLLVGPFKTDDEAQAYVNRMSKAGLSAFTFTSEKGQEIAKLATGKKK